MTSVKWDLFKSILKGDEEKLHVGLVVDSPWMPGYCGISTVDFYVRPEEWFNAYVKIKKDFPDVLFLPDWWAEYGMATEPSGFGVKFNFHEDNLPTIHHLVDDSDEIDDIILGWKVPDPRKDGLMPLLLNLQRYMKPKMDEIGEKINIVSTRGPLTIASHIFSVSEILILVKSDPDVAHRLMKMMTQLCKDWLEVQLENVGTAEGVLVLDDVMGFFGTDDYKEFAHPNFKEIFSAFPECIHFLHNDTPNPNCFPFIEDLGVDLFNFTHEKDIGSVRKLVGDKVTLLGNVPPMSLAKKSADEVYELTKTCIDDYISVAGNTKGLLLSVGGGVPMEAKGECINAMVKAAKEY